MAPRHLHDHQINEFNSEHVIVMPYDEVGPGGAHHQYAIFLVTDPHSRNPPDVILNFQNGPVGEAGVNGITEEALLAIILDRYRGFQRGAYSCRQNALAITKLEETLHWLMDRSIERQRRGVEGTSQV